MNSLRVPDLGSMVEASPGGDLGQVAVEGGHIGLYGGNAPGNEIGGERKARRVVVAHLAAGAVARLAVGAGGTLDALGLGLLARDGRELQQRGVELLEPASKRRSARSGRT